MNVTAPVRQHSIAETWLAALSEALQRRDFDRVARMMHADCYWRDLLTFGWDFKTSHGVDEVKSWLVGAFDPVGAHGFRLEGEPTVGAIGEHPRTLEFFFRFETKIALGRGYVRLVGDITSGGTPKVFTVLTAMNELKGFPEARDGTASVRTCVPPRATWKIGSTEGRRRANSGIAIPTSSSSAPASRA